MNISGMSDARIVARQARLVDGALLGTFALFLLLGILAAVLDALSVVLLVDLVAGTLMTDAAVAPVVASALALGSREGLGAGSSILALIVALLVARAALFVVSGGVDARLSASVRRKLQEEGVRRLFGAEWSAARDVRIGAAIQALTEEAASVTKYYISIGRAAQALLMLAVLGGFAARVDGEMTIVLVLAGVPAFAALYAVFRYQARVSARAARSRLAFAADLAERAAGLFQVKAGGDAERHASATARHQGPLARDEQLLGLTSGAIGGFVVLLPALALAAVFAWAAMRSVAWDASAVLLAQVGGVGLRAATALNVLVASWGNFSRLSGSFPPMRRVFDLTPDAPRALVEGRVVAVHVKGASYSFGAGRQVGPVRLAVRAGSPLVLRGPSGSGKSTLANLICGLYKAQEGEVLYESDSGRLWSAATHRARVGYVTQDVFLFDGSVRANVDPEGTLDDVAVWAILERTGAAAFVRDMGGLDAPITEAGRSLSGGQRRRLGIARCLGARPDIVVLDEVTNGLDETNRRIIRDAALDAAKDRVVLVITHQDDFDGIPAFTLDAAPLTGP